MPHARRTRRAREPMTWVAVIVALAVHGAVLGTVNALGITMIGQGFVGGSTPKPEVGGDADLDLKTSCFSDVVFATSGRAAMCLAPWVGDVDKCMSEMQLNLWMDIASCEGRLDPGTEITMVEPKAVEKLEVIDPERLLEETQREVKPPPPPPPPPQPQQSQAAPPPPPPPPQTLQQQVVETVKPNEEKEPENARFLAEYNTRVEKQKVARGGRAAEPMVAKSRPEELTPKTKPKDEPSVNKQEPDRQIGKNERAPDLPGKL